MSKLLKILLFLLPAVLHTASGHSLAMQAWCYWSKADLSDMEYIEPYVFNKINYLEFNSTLGKFVGYTALGIKNAEAWNKDTADLTARKANVESVCKPNAGIYYSNVLSKTVEPQVEVALVKKSDGTHPARLMCSAYSFYPPLITVTWLRNGKEIKGASKNPWSISGIPPCLNLIRVRLLSGLQGWCWASCFQLLDSSTTRRKPQDGFWSRHKLRSLSRNTGVFAEVASSVKHLLYS
ncbi:hypothetical protein PDJAM_G00246890 [Pangasius djambal]|uniref:Uncharacterized protein n=1 Tax=Pangasius djambal TaxID=1691987 RepID=A0ACC5YIP6_9TELE|nr:hypothetical protein [Pangasius djambal]